MKSVPKNLIKVDGISAIGSYTASLWKNKKIVLISDNEAFETYGAQTLQYLSIFGFEVQTLILSDIIYSTNTANLVYEFLNNQNMTQTDGIIGLGNEALCQLSGYVAATYRDGLSLIQIPTTLIGQLTISKQKQACLLNPQAKQLQSVTIEPDGIIIDTKLSDNVSQEELKSAQTLMLNLGLSQDHDCRCELRKKNQISGHQLNYKKLLDGLPSNILFTKKVSLGLSLKNLHSRSLSHFDVHPKY